MNTKQDIDGFLKEKTIAIVGISRDPKSFSAMANKELKAKGWRTVPVNPKAEAIDGEKCHPDLASLSEKPAAVLVMTPPGETAKVVREAVAAGIRKIWIQQGAQSEEALRLCREGGVEAVAGKCIMMFAEPVGSFHAFHRWFARLFGQVPR
jgi:uncharacterized protein